MGKDIDSKGQEIDWEVEWYCPQCEDFRDVDQGWGDIACRECHTPIATFRKREVTG